MEKSQILELAATIGKEVKESELMKAYEKAEALYVADEALQDKIREYSVQQQLLAEENTKSEPNSFIIETIQGRLQGLYGEITASKTFVEFSEKQDQVRELLTQINNVMMQQITGEDPSACTHDCSTCHGCH